MSQRIQHKRSSVEGRRPSGAYLEPGEIALNTSAADPGIFFESSDGSIVKAGPTAISETKPESAVGYGQGEAWYDSGNKTLSFYDSEVQDWVKTYAAPYGGSKTLLYVGSQFPEATDSLSNDGESLPFASLNRACMEIARRSILQNRLDDVYAEQFVILLLPGTNIAFNEPGLNLEEFQENIPVFRDNQDISPYILRSMNPETGGVLLPRGASIIGLDVRKTLLRPSYYPYWDRESFEHESLREALLPRTNIIKWTGGSFISNVGFRDKREVVSVTRILGEEGDAAILETLIPHGFRSYVTSETDTSEDSMEVLCDTVRLEYPENVSQTYEGFESVTEGNFHVEPISPTQFYLRNPINNNILPRQALPFAPDPGTRPEEFLTLTYTNTTHHRLTAVGFAQQNELVHYYAKVQRAFGNLDFNGQVNVANVISSEVNIVTTPETNCENEVLTTIDDNTYGSPKIYHCDLRTNWGMNGLAVDGSLVGGFRSVNVDKFTVNSAQTDSDVYEVYYDDTWVSLGEAYWRSNNLLPQKIDNTIAMRYLIDSVELGNFRTYYRAAFDLPDSDDQSSGLPDDLSDTRNYAVLASNEGIVRITNSSSSGCNVHLWARNGGGIISSAYGSTLGFQSIRSEGFKGIGTNRGAERNSTGFNIKGIRRPSLVHSSELKNESNRIYLYLNANIVASTSKTLTLSEQVNLRALQPYTLRPGTAIWVADVINNEVYSAILDDTPVADDLITLNVVAASNEIHGKDLNDLAPPFIRRFVDPRPEAYRNYSLWIENTRQDHQPPTPGAVLRLAELVTTRITPLLVPGKQLDPGQNGGWNHLFSVHQVFTKEDGNNPNLSFPPSVVPNSSDGYYLALRLGDSASPWTADQKYSSGSHATRLLKPLIASKEETTSPAVYTPADFRSVFTESKTFEYALPYEKNWEGEGSSDAADPNSSSYIEGDTYLRGVGPSPGDYSLANAIDYDDGTDDLGLSSGDFVSNQFVNPDHSHSKAALSRLLVLLGYESEDIDAVLTPQKWSQRNLPITSFPDIGGEGYALSEGEWPVEFNTPSTIIVSNHRWESPGYYNYSKGLPRQRTTQLSSRLRFDSTLAEVWGGIVRAEGLTDAGEFVTSRLAQVSGSGSATLPQLSTDNSVISEAPSKIDNGRYVIV